MPATSRLGTLPVPAAHRRPRLNNPTAHLEARLQSTLADLPENQKQATRLQPPKDRKFGDLALPCFNLAKLRKLPPPAVATQIAEEFETDEVI